MRKILACAMVAGLAACGGEQAAQPEGGATDTATEPTEASATPATAQGTTAAGGASLSATPGQLLVVTKTSECYEVGPNASDMPWTMGQGTHVKFVIAAEGGKTRVKGPSGDECLIDTAAIAVE